MILRRYMIREVATHTALVLGFLVVLTLGGRLIRYFGAAAEGRLDTSLLLTLIGYNLPYFLELILPLAFFIALMLVFGRLYVDNEMAVINSSGISRGAVARLMVPLIVLLFVLEAGLSMVAKPWGMRESENIWQTQALSSAFDLIRANEFISSGDYHLYVGSLSDDKKQLQDVILIQSSRQQRASDADLLAMAAAATSDTASDLEADEPAASSLSLAKSNPKKDTIIFAKRAQQVDNSASLDAGATQLDLYQGRRYELAADSLKYNQVGFERYRISLTEPKKEQVNDTNIATQPIVPLWLAATGHDITSIIKTSSDLSAISVDSSRQTLRAARAELGYRLALPWLMIIAPMLAVPLAQVRPRQGRWLRLFPAILLFVSCALVIISLKNSVSKGNLSVWAYVWVILGFMGLALYLNWASRLHHRLKFGVLQPSTSLPKTTESTVIAQDDVNNTANNKNDDKNKKDAYVRGQQ